MSSYNNENLYYLIIVTNAGKYTVINSVSGQIVKELLIKFLLKYEKLVKVNLKNKIYLIE